MNDDAFERLRGENPFPETLPAPAIERVLGRVGERGSAPRSGRRPAFGRVAVAAGVAMAAVVGVLAVVLLGGRHGAPPVVGHHGLPAPPSQGTLVSYLHAAYQETVEHDAACGLAHPVLGGTASDSDGAPSRALLSAFSVLRRPATAADRLPQSDYAGPFLRVVYVRYIRRARVVDGTAYYLIPGQVGKVGRGLNGVPLRCYGEQRAALRTLVVSLPAGRRVAIMHAGTQVLAQEPRAGIGFRGGPDDGVELVGLGHGGGGTCCVGASRLPNQVSIGITGSIAHGVVPDGVASVSLYYANTPSQSVPTIIAKATRTITAKVVDNVYVVTVGNRGRPEPSAVVYRAASGAVLRGFATNQ